MTRAEDRGMPPKRCRTLLLVAFLGLTRLGLGQPTNQELIEAGRHKLERGDVAGATADFERAVKADPKDPKAYFARAIGKSKKGDNEGALSDYSRAVELNPRFAQAYINRGAIQWRNGDLNLALNDFNHALDADPNLVQALNARGVIKDALGDRIGARTDYNRALDINPDFLPTYGNRGQSYYLSRSWEPALADFRHAFSAGMANQDYLRLYAWIIRQRLGAVEIGDNELAAYLQKRNADPGEWFNTLGHYLLGKVSENDLITAAGPLAGDRQKQCEVWFYVGMKRLLAGDKPAAIQDLHKCVDTGVKMASEYLFAEAELKELEK
jgi:Flp pilus assembly protein TadD